MPELPEVETVRQTLRNFVLNKCIDSVEVLYDRIIEDDVDVFIDSVSTPKFSSGLILHTSTIKCPMKRSSRSNVIVKCIIPKFPLRFAVLV